MCDITIISGLIGSINVMQLQNKCTANYLHSFYFSNWQWFFGKWLQVEEMAAMESQFLYGSTENRSVASIENCWLAWWFDSASVGDLRHGSPDMWQLKKWHPVWILPGVSTCSSKPQANKKSSIYSLNLVSPLGHGIGSIFWLKWDLSIRTFCEDSPTVHTAMKMVPWVGGQ